MNNKNNSIDSASGSSEKSAGGIFIALGTIIGVIGGGFLGQPSIGFLVGLALGGLIALIIWLRER